MDFYRKCTGFGKKAFDKLYKFVVNYGMVGRSESPYDKYFTKEGLTYALYGRASLRIPEPVEEFNETFTPKPQKSKKQDTDLEHVLLFLDDYFDLHDVDRDPTKPIFRYIKTTWHQVYDEYMMFCNRMNLKPARYDKFCSIRCDYFHVFTFNYFHAFT